MSVQRSQLVRGPAIATFNGATFFNRADISIRPVAVWKGVETSMYGEVDKAKTDLMIKVNLTLWGAYENLPIIFPAYALNPVMGSSIFGNGDVPLVINARNGDLFTFANAALTKLPDLYLGVDEDLFSAALEFTCLLGNGHNPEDVGAYFTLGNQAFNDGAFSKANYKRTRFTGAWTGVAGFGLVTPQKGFHVGWTLDAKPVPAVDGLGTLDFTVAGFKAAAKFIPIGPTDAQIEAQSLLSTPMGTLASSGSASFIMTGANGGPAITINGAAMVEHGFEFGIEPLRAGEIALESQRTFNGGVPNPIAIVA